MRQELENLLLHLSAALLLMNAHKDSQKDYQEAIKAHMTLALEATKVLMGMEARPAQEPFDVQAVKRLIEDGLSANGPNRDHDTYYHRLLNRLAYTLHINLDGDDDPTPYPNNALE